VRGRADVTTVSLAARDHCSGCAAPAGEVAAAVAEEEDRARGRAVEGGARRATRGSRCGAERRLVDNRSTASMREATEDRAKEPILSCGGRCRKSENMNLRIYSMCKFM